MERNCSICGATLSQGNPGTLCSPCQAKKLAHLDASDDPYYTVGELAHILGLESDESIKRLSRKGKIPGRLPGIKKHLYSKEIVDAWIKSNNTVKAMPASPLQQEAYDMCCRGNHGWMSDERFEGHACKLETFSEIKNNRLIMTNRRTCHFCGHVDHSPFI